MATSSGTARESLLDEMAADDHTRYRGDTYARQAEDFGTAEATWACSADLVEAIDQSRHLLLASTEVGFHE